MNKKRLTLFGSGSFIAHSIIETCRSQGREHVPLRHGEDLAAILRPGDSVINFAIDPQYRTGIYSEDHDADLRAARITRQAGAHFVMLSTRRVYGPEIRWNATETSKVAGDETAYGRNKATTEERVRQACPDAGIFRLSNIFGYEYTPAAARRSFLGQLLFSLNRQGKVFFDMHPDTRRDFLPIEACANQLVARALDATPGTFNLGGGFPIACGTLAEWVMEGFGSGELIANTVMVRDEFYLNMTAWRSRYDLPIGEKTLKDYCLRLGSRLQCEKS